MRSDWPQLLLAAQTEVEVTLNALPPELQAPARGVPVVYERRPGRALRRDGLDLDTLGLFVGEPFEDELSVSGHLPAQIILFLENLWEFSGGEEPVFRAEIRKTLLHEMGHYLGLDENDLADRGLE